MTDSRTADALMRVHSADSFEAQGFEYPDVYFGPAYGRAEEANGSGEWISVVGFDGLWQMPLHLRHSTVGTDAVSPYGYAGVYASPRLSEADRKAAWADAKEALQERAVLSIFLRQTPLFDSPFVEPPGEKIVDGHATIRVDTSDAMDPWAGMEGRSRTSVRKAERDGYKTVVRPATSSDVASASPFRQLYEGAMERRGAADHYFFTDAYYATLCDGLADDLLIGITLDTQDRAVAAALFLRHGDHLHYHLSGSEHDAGRAGATNQLIWQAIQWAREAGVVRLHLGGGVSNQDSLFKFKRSFGGNTLHFDAFGVVLDESSYHAAVKSRAEELDRPTHDLLNANYFPSFRVPA